MKLLYIVCQTCIQRPRLEPQKVAADGRWWLYTGNPNWWLLLPGGHYSAKFVTSGLIVKLNFGLTYPT